MRTKGQTIREAATASEARTGWAHIPLKELATVVRGVSYKKGDASETPRANYVPILRATNIQENCLVLDRELIYVPAKYVSAEQKLRSGDIVVATSSGSKHLVGKTAQVKSEWDGSFGAFCAVIRPSNGVDVRYLAHFFESPAYKKHISSRTLGVNINNLRRADIEEIVVPVAPPNQQQRIVAEIEKQFSRLDEAVANLKRVKANLKRYKAAVLKAAVEGKFTEEWRKQHPGVEHASELLKRIRVERRAKWKGNGKYKEPGESDSSGFHELPKGWVWTSVESLSMKVVDGVHKKPDYVSTGVPFVTVRNLTAGSGIDFGNLKYISPQDHEDFIRRADPEQGDILISKDGTLGVVRVVRTNMTFSIFVSVAMVKPVLKQMSDYLGVALSSPQVQKQMAPKGSGLQHIHLEDLRADCVPLPPLEEQREIVAEVERRFSVVEEIVAQVDKDLTRAEGLRSSVLASAFICRATGPMDSGPQ